MVKNLPANAGDAGDRVQSLGQEDPLEKEMATPGFLLGEFHEQRRLVFTVHEVSKSQTQLSEHTNAGDARDLGSIPGFGRSPGG